MSLNINNVQLAGHLTKDPELQTTAGGKAYCRFSVAVNNAWTDQAGQRHEDTTFVDCQAWAPMGANIAKWLKKGSPIYVEGRITQDTWQGTDGKTVRKTRVAVARFQFVPDSKGGKHESPLPKDSQPPPAGSPTPFSPLEDAWDDIPF